jgi:hypothetical protein
MPQRIGAASFLLFLRLFESSRERKRGNPEELARDTGIIIRLFERFADQMLLHHLEGREASLVTELHERIALSRGRFNGARSSLCIDVFPEIRKRKNLGFIRIKSIAHDRFP